MAAEQRKPWSNSTWKEEAPCQPHNPVATWHRIGWKQRSYRTTRARGEPQCTQKPSGQRNQQQGSHIPQQSSQRHKRQKPAQQQQQSQQQQTNVHQDMRPVVAHTHSCTYMYSHRQTYTHRVTLMKSWMPGVDGAPAAALNTEELCDELNTRLLNIDHTLLALLASNQPRQQLLDGSNEAMQQQLASSLEKQMAFSTSCLQEWCGVTPVGSSEQVLQQLLGNKP